SLFGSAVPPMVKLTVNGLAVSLRVNLKIRFGPESSGTVVSAARATVTTGVTGETAWTAPENSDVLPSPSMAVAVIHEPTGTGEFGLKVKATSLGDGATEVEPIKVLPSPYPDGSLPGVGSGLMKNSIRYSPLVFEFSVPLTVLTPASVMAEVITG